MKAVQRKAKMGEIIVDVWDGRKFLVKEVTDRGVYFDRPQTANGVVVDWKSGFLRHKHYRVLEEEQPVPEGVEVKMKPSYIRMDDEKTTITYPNGAKKVLTAGEIRYVMPVDDHITSNEILADVLEQFVKQTNKGVKKYGNTVNPDEYSTIEWINHAIEESIDHIVYLTTLKKKLAKREESK